MIRAALLLALLCPSGLGAYSAGADFLRAEIPARPAALSGAFAAFHDDVSAFLWNPAALAFVEQPWLGATHFTSVLDTDFDQANLTLPLRFFKARGGLGLSIQHSATGNLNEIDLNGNDLGAIQNGDWVLEGAGALRFGRGLAAGVALKGFYSTLAEFRSRGAAVDIGLFSEVNAQLSFALAVADLGFAEAYDNAADALPSILRVAAKGVLVDVEEIKVNLAAELDRPFAPSDPILFNAGVEYWYAGKVAFRAGYRLGSDLGGFSTGVGVRWRGLGFDYAYAAMGELGLTHRFSFNAELGSFFEQAGLLSQASR